MSKTTVWKSLNSNQSDSRSVAAKKARAHPAIPHPFNILCIVVLAFLCFESFHLKQWASTLCCLKPGFFFIFHSAGLKESPS